MLFNEPKLLKLSGYGSPRACRTRFSALQRAEIAEIPEKRRFFDLYRTVSVLFNEPKLLKSYRPASSSDARICFSALQRAEIAEMERSSARLPTRSRGFSALQRAEIAEILVCLARVPLPELVSVLFNEPKLLKLKLSRLVFTSFLGFSALQRAEIAEISASTSDPALVTVFQCSSTSRNC